MDLAQIPTADLRAELKRRVKLGRPAKISVCPRCGASISARQSQKKCPHV